MDKKLYEFIVPVSRHVTDRNKNEFLSIKTIGLFATMYPQKIVSTDGKKLSVIKRDTQ